MWLSSDLFHITLTRYALLASGTGPLSNNLKTNNPFPLQLKLQGGLRGVWKLIHLDMSIILLHVQYIILLILGVTDNVAKAYLKI